MSGVIEQSEQANRSRSVTAAADARALDPHLVLYQFTDRLYRAETEQDIYEAALDAIITGLRCQRASILLFDSEGVMQFVASRGLSADYRAAVAGHTPWRPGEAQPEPIQIDDMEGSDTPEPLKSTILGEGIAALAFIPLVAQGGVIGKFMAYRNQPEQFSSDDVDLGVTIARQLGFALERERAAQSLIASERRFKTLTSHAPVGIFQTDAAGNCLFVNETWCDVAGMAPEEAAGQGWGRALHPEDRERVFRDWYAAAEREQEFSGEYRFCTPQGRVSWVQGTAQPMRDSSGRITGYIGSLVDITERRRSAQRQRESDAEFRTLADNIHQFAWMTDAEGWIYWYNQRWFDFTGTTLEEMQGWGWTKVHHPDHVERVVDGFRRAIEAGRPWEDTFPLRSRDGQYRWFLSRALPIRDESGQVVRWFGTNTDITERLQAEEQRTLLINELNHRVKNTLATVQSLAMQTLRGDEHNKEALALFNSRLLALSRAHDILTGESWKGAQLRQIVDQAVAPFRTKDRIEVGGPDARLTPKQALALCIALHELGTNAMKYGALSSQSGVVTLSWSVDEGLLHMSWRESGGPAVTPPTRVGFGTRLIERSLAHDLGGEARILYLPAGVVAQMSTPLEKTES